MRIRYTTENNKAKEVARVYSENEHSIDYSKIDPDAISVMNRLISNGFETYLVGGAVRDLYLGLSPKDFDVVTDASPRQVHRLFKNSRLIGRRFRIVHVVFGNKIIEVSTFRSTEDQDLKNDNKFGTVEEDAKRRDFSLNSLYYNIENHTLIDFNNAIRDIKEHKIVSLIPVNRTFLEDPVRMIRAVKYSVSTGFNLKWNIKRSIKKFAPALVNISPSRLTEELNKILLGGHSFDILEQLNRYKLLVYMLPSFCVYSGAIQIKQSLCTLDGMVQDWKKGKAGEVSHEQAYAALVSPLIIIDRTLNSPSEVYKDVIRQIKILVSPNTPPNHQIEAVAKMILLENGITLSKPTPKKHSNALQKKENNRKAYTKRRSKVNSRTELQQ